MAKIFGKNREVDFAPGNLMSFGKSFSRMGGQPLDESEVWYDYNALVEFAAGNAAYVGMKVVYVDEAKSKVYQYSIQLDGSLKEIGVAPIGDNSSIVVDAESGTVSLKGIAGLAFEKDIIGEDGQPTGEKEEVQYQPLMTKDGLVWVIPSKTTVEGLASLIDALTLRVKALEDDRVTEEELAEAIKDFATDAEVEAAVKVETDRAKAAEKALGERIDAIDFVDEDELADAIKDFETKANVKVAKDRADEAYALAETKVNASDYATDKKALQDEDAAIRAIAEGVQTAFNTFMESENIDDTINTLKEIQAELDKMAEATELTEALATKADTSYVNEELAKKQDVIAENTYDAYGAAAQALSDAQSYAEGQASAAQTAAQGYADGVAAQALADAKADAAANYATIETVNGIDGRVTALEGFDHSVYATKEELAPVTQTANNASTAVANLETRFDEIVAVGGEPNAINKIQVNGTELSITDKTVNIAVPVSFSDLTDNSGFDARITAAQSQADKGVADAKKVADDLSTLASGQVTTNANDIANLKTKTDSTNTVVSGQGERISAIETNISTTITPAIEALVAKDTEIEGVIAGHTGNITALQTKDGELAGLINTNAQNIDAINTKIGTVATDKTVVDMIADAITSASRYADSLAGNYDEAGAANKAFEDAKQYADGLAVNYDDFGSAAQALVDAKAYADGLAGNYDAAGAADGALVAAKAYADGLAGNYDAKGSAEAAETAAKAYADSLASNYDASGSAAKALTDAKAYTDEIKATILGENDKLVETFDTLSEIGQWIETSGATATDLTEAIAAEKKAREEADTALAGRLAILEAIDHDAYVDADAELKEALEGQISALANGAVKANTEAIAAINDATNGILATAKAYTDSLANGAVAANTAAIAAINHAETGILAVAKAYTDTEVAGAKSYADGLVAAIVQPKASNEVTVAADGTLGLGEVSTDKLVQGSMTLILHGGDAGVSIQA